MQRYRFLTWKTVITALQKESKLLRGIWSPSILNLEEEQEWRQLNVLLAFSLFQAPGQYTVFRSLAFSLLARLFVSSELHRLTNIPQACICSLSSNWQMKGLGHTYRPPKICIPSNEQISIKRERSNSKPAMDLMLLSSEATKLLKELQYLKQRI